MPQSLTVGSRHAPKTPRLVLFNISRFTFTFGKAFVEVVGISMGGIMIMPCDKLDKCFCTKGFKNTHENPSNIMCPLKAITVRAQRYPVTFRCVAEGTHNAVSHASRRASKIADSREVEGRLVAPPETNDIDKSLDREEDNTRRTAASMNDEAPLS